MRSPGPRSWRSFSPPDRGGRGAGMGGCGARMRVRARACGSGRGHARARRGHAGQGAGVRGHGAGMWVGAQACEVAPRPCGIAPRTSEIAARACRARRGRAAIDRGGRARPLLLRAPRFRKLLGLARPQFGPQTRGPTPPRRDMGRIQRGARACGRPRRGHAGASTSAAARSSGAATPPRPQIRQLRQQFRQPLGLTPPNSARTRAANTSPQRHGPHPTRSGPITAGPGASTPAPRRPPLLDPPGPLLLRASRIRQLRQPLGLPRPVQPAHAQPTAPRSAMGRIERGPRARRPTEAQARLLLGIHIHHHSPPPTPPRPLRPSDGPAGSAVPSVSRARRGRVRRVGVRPGVPRLRGPRRRVRLPWG
ncbi:hypothetical protein HMPREF1211_00955 [Streptomyces sp. HGB0020]|nr:hypothetical protein HMPREF1211_00955 [Streptomyces sp. HGB0020]